MSNHIGDNSLEFYRRMFLIRIFEEHAESLHAQGEIRGALHTSSGQEGEIVGACMALRTDDYMVGNHRSHGHPIAKGAAIRPLMAELFGKSTGVCKGKGGSMHLSDFAVGSLGETSIVGSGLPVAVGAALGSQLQGLDRVALCFFGDGASNEGTFHESLNLASIWKVPTIFLCENNGYGLTTPIAEVAGVKDIADRAAGYGMPGIVVDGQDVMQVYHIVLAAVERARARGGPTLIEAKTYRYSEHAVNMGRVLHERGNEVEQWRSRDPIQLFRARIIEQGVNPSTIGAMEEDVRAEVADAVAFARSSPFPNAEEAFDDVFVKQYPIAGQFASWA
jgi:acetoin:2,6-dichlorophenolindophenol oxidoreductase subunit alpha